MRKRRKEQKNERRMQDEGGQTGEKEAAEGGQ